MRKYLLIFFLLIAACSTSFATSSALLFKKNYLTLDLPLSIVSGVYGQISEDYPALKSRGEAHITLLTPIEFRQHFLPAGITMKKIKRELLSYSLDLDFTQLAVGSGKVGEMETFFVIVEGDGLLEVRHILKRILNEAKPSNSFRPEWFFPHITVGFTHRDLHESDGVIKDLENAIDTRYSL